MKLSSILVLATICALAFAECIISEQAALENLYTLTNGAGWTTKTNWMVGSPCADSWFGISCNKDNYVIGIELANNNLVGPLIADIGCFPFLKTLQLGGNQLNGPIPTEIGDLAHLKYLNLEKNELVGTLPASLCGPVDEERYIQYLYLGFNMLEGPVPACYTTHFPFIKEIHLECNELTEDLPDFSTYEYLFEVRSRCNLWTVDCPAFTDTEGILWECEGDCSDCPTIPTVECPTTIVNECGTYELILA